jgi:hypothetical protein
MAAIVLGLFITVVGEDMEALPISKAVSVVPITMTSEKPGLESESDWVLTHSGPTDREACNLPRPEGNMVGSGSDREGDSCDNPIVINIGSGDLPYSLYGQTTCGYVNNYDNTCLGNFDGGEDIIYQLNLSENLNLSILIDPKSSVFTGILIDDACPPDPSTCLAKSVKSTAVPHGIVNIALTVGTYYIMVDTWPPPGCIPEFDLSIELFIESPGDDCNDPVKVKLPIDMNGGPNNDSYIDENYTCGRVNDYDNTCLEEEYDFDGGEDIIYELDVTEAVTVDIFLDPGSTDWTGILIDDNCPPDEVGCIQFSVIGTGAHGLYDLALDPGIYYVMVDTWPYPDCIPTFTLTIRSVDDRLENDAWENCTAIGDVVDLAFSTKQATPDGPGGCLTSPTLWYCYTASCSGRATISLCGSDYNTKMAVFDGTNPFYDPMLGCNDDACGQQSELKVDVIQGNTYLVGVGGWMDITGDGILSTSCLVNDDCENVTPVTLDDGIPVTFTGDNTNATHQCDFFDGAHTWHAFTLDTTMIVTLDYCTTDPAFTNAWLNLAIGCPCTGVSGAGVYNSEDCGDGNLTITWDYLEAGTYYYPVMLAEGAEGPYTLHVSGETVVVYCYASGGCNHEFISRVAIGDIDNSSECENYADYTYLSTTLRTDSTYEIIVELGDGIYLDIGVVWIDWNQNFVFEYDEEVDLDVNQGEGPYTGTVVPPSNATNGPTRMRVRLNYNSYPPPCGETMYGEVEDYTVDVIVTYICGDANGDHIVNVSDAVAIINYVFVSGDPPDPIESGDCNCDDLCNVSDAVWIINYVFVGGNDPCDTDGDGEPDC